jgi:hypothetical protein
MGNNASAPAQPMMMGGTIAQPGTINASMEKGSLARPGIVYAQSMDKGESKGTINASMVKADSAGTISMGNAQSTGTRISISNRSGFDIKIKLARIDSKGVIVSTILSGRFVNIDDAHKSVLNVMNNVTGNDIVKPIIVVPGDIITIETIASKKEPSAPASTTPPRMVAITTPPAMRVPTTPTMAMFASPTPTPTAYMNRSTPTMAPLSPPKSVSDIRSQALGQF